MVVRENLDRKKNGQKLFEGSDMIVEAFRKHIFRFPNADSDDSKPDDSEFYDSDFDDSKFDLISDLEQKSWKSIGERVKLRRQESNELNQMITRNDKIINKEFLKIYFQFESLSDMQKALDKAKNAQKNKELAPAIKNRLLDLESEIKKMSEDETAIEKPHKIIDAVAEILYSNNKKQSGQGLKILTPQQMLSRLLISLAQLKKGNNSEKLKNEIGQLLYSLYKSKKLSKTIHKYLINAI